MFLARSRRAGEDAPLVYCPHAPEGIPEGACIPWSLSRVTAEEIAGYLQEVSAQAQLTDWQFRQLVDALQLLFVDLGQCAAGNEIDWDWWKAGGRLLGDHPTIRPSDHRTLKAPSREAAGRSRVCPRCRGCSAAEDPGPDHPGNAVLDPHRAGLRRWVPPVSGLLRGDAEGASGGWGWCGAS